MRVNWPNGETRYSYLTLTVNELECPVARNGEEKTKSIILVKRDEVLS